MRKNIIKMGISMALGVVITLIGSNIAKRIKKENGKESNKKIEKFKSYYNILNQWLLIKQSGKSLENYFIDNNYRTVAIYGMGELGYRLSNELNNSSIGVKYVIDKNANGSYSEFEMYSPDDDRFPDVDVIVVTAVFAFDEIEEQIVKKVSCPVVSIEDVVYDL